MPNYSQPFLMQDYAERRDSDSLPLKDGHKSALSLDGIGNALYFLGSAISVCSEEERVIWPIVPIHVSLYGKCQSVAMDVAPEVPVICR